MHRHRLERFPVSVLAAICLLLSGCGDDRVAGTSTSIGTGIGGKVMLSNGAAGAGARVVARSDTLEVRNGQLGCKLLDSARADGEGRFSLPRLPRGEFYLEIISSKSHADSGPEVYFEHFFISFLADSSLGTLMTSAAGSLQGKAERLQGASDSSVWIGIVGTDHFAMATPSDPSHGSFRLDGLYPAEYFLTLVTGVDGSGGPVMAKKQPVKVTAGTVTTVDVSF